MDRKDLPIELPEKCPHCGAETKEDIGVCMSCDEQLVRGEICNGCGELIRVGEPAYAVQSGYIDDDGEFVRTDSQSQIFHIGRCLNSEE
jgi:rRNA maturation protein Nop10